MDVNKSNASLLPTDVPKNSSQNKSNASLQPTGVPKNSTQNKSNASLLPTGVPKNSTQNKLNASLLPTGVPKNSTQNKLNVSLLPTDVPKNSTLKPESPYPAVFLVKVKTNDGITTQLCKKVIWLNKDNSQMNQQFQPLTANELKTIFHKPRSIKIVEGTVVLKYSIGETPPLMSQVGTLPSVVPALSVWNKSPNISKPLVNTKLMPVTTLKPDTVTRVTTKPVSGIRDQPVLNTSKPATVTVTSVTKDTITEAVPAISNPDCNNTKPTIKIMKTVTPIAQSLNSARASVANLYKEGSRQTKLLPKDKSDAPPSILSLPNNSSITLRRIPGSGNFVIENMLSTSSTNSASKHVSISNEAATGVQKIPVGKVLPLQISTSTLQSTPRVEYLTTNVYKFGQNNAENTIQVPNKLEHSGESLSTTNMNIGLSRTILSKDCLEKDTLNQIVTPCLKYVVSSTPEPVVTSSVISAVSPLTNLKETVDMGEKDNSVVSESTVMDLFHVEPIPMKITAVVDNGAEICVSRRDDKNSESTLDLNIDKTSVLDTCDLAKSLDDDTTNNSTSNQNEEEDSSTSSVSKENNGVSNTMHNVYARVYLAPDSNLNEFDDRTNTQDKKTSSALKIGSVFSLNEDQVKDFFPGNNNSGATADLESSSTRDLESRYLPDNITAVHIKKEPSDRQRVGDSGQFMSDYVHVKEEPQDDMIQVKKEPNDEYKYSNYPVPNDEIDEDTDTASETSPKRIKQELIKSTNQETTSTSKFSSQLSKPLELASKQTTTASSSKKSDVLTSLIFGGQIKSNGQMLSVAGGQGIVTDINGKKFIVLSAPGHSISGIKDQHKVITRPDPAIASPSSKLGKSYLVTMANGQRRLVHMPVGTPASTLLASLSKGKIVQLPLNPVAGNRFAVTSPKSNKKCKSQIKVTRKKGQVDAMQLGKLPTIIPTTSSTVSVGPATKLMQTIVSSAIKHKGELSKIPIENKYQQQKVAVIPRQELKDEPIDRRRSYRERKVKRRYSPPPLGPRKRHLYTVHTPNQLQNEAPKLGHSSTTGITKSCDNVHTNDTTDSEPLTPAVASREDRMRLLKELIREKEATLEEMRKQRKREQDERQNDPDLMDL